MTRYAELKALVQKWRDSAAEHNARKGVIVSVASNTLLHAARELEAAIALPEDGKVVNAELYGLAVELADSAARSDIECLCDFGEEAVGVWYFLTGHGPEFAKDITRAARYLSLREQYGEPMPYKVVREGDRVRFE